jgi:hypothetical protein
MRMFASIPITHPSLCHTSFITVANYRHISCVSTREGVDMTKIYTSLVTAFAAVAASAAVAPVQAQEVHLVARVPFDFAVGAANLPRDTYQVTRMAGHPEMLFLRGDRTGAFVRTNEERVPRDAGTPMLVFHRYGDQYFLRQVRWTGSARLELPETKSERAAAERRADRAAAAMETVTIAAEPR